MKLLRVGEKGKEQPAIIDSEGNIRSIQPITEKQTAHVFSEDSLKKIREADLYQLPLIDKKTRIGACVDNIGKILCIGVNYREHAKETGHALPSEPLVFTKNTSSVIGPFDEVVIPKHSQKTDWEVELALVIGKPAKYVSKGDALDYVAGYFVMNDITERAWQREGTGQWIKGKGCDTFAPIGPYVVTTDEITTPQSLDLWLEVDGVRYQQGHTSDMIFPVDFLVSYLSQFFTLLPGDIISTGTPPGVGFGQKPEPLFLKPNQHIRLSVEGLGEQHLTTIAEN